MQVNKFREIQSKHEKYKKKAAKKTILCDSLERAPQRKSKTNTNLILSIAKIFEKPAKIKYFLSILKDPYINIDTYDFELFLQDNNLQYSNLNRYCRYSLQRFYRFF